MAYTTCLRSQTLDWADWQVLAFPIEERHHDCKGSQHRQREKLAEHTLVELRLKLHKVSRTMVVHALRFYKLCRMVDVNRRQQQHRQEHCQQNPC